MKRREFVAGLAGLAAWPCLVRAQQPDRMRRIGLLMPLAKDDPEAQARISAFLQGLEKAGWVNGRNLQMELRWTAGDAEVTRRHVAELIAFTPDVILASGGAALGPLLQATRSVPVVFTLTPDPVGAGFVESLARPGGNLTGFTQFEYGMAAQWLGLLKQIAPSLTRAAVLRDPPAITQGPAQYAAVQAVAPSLGVEISAVSINDATEIERATSAFARLPNSGLIVTASGLANVHRELIIRLAGQHRLPAIYPNRRFVIDGGLISYGADAIDPHRRAAIYVDRILKGDKPADMPVQTPVKFELLVNLKTARSLAVTIP